MRYFVDADGSVSFVKNVIDVKVESITPQEKVETSFSKIKCKKKTKKHKQKLKKKFSKISTIDSIYEAIKSGESIPTDVINKILKKSNKTVKRNKEGTPIVSKNSKQNFTKSFTGGSVPFVNPVIERQPVENQHQIREQGRFGSMPLYDNMDGE